jgi:hypothetical protein
MITLGTRRRIFRNDEIEFISVHAFQESHTKIYRQLQCDGRMHPAKSLENSRQMIIGEVVTNAETYPPSDLQIVHLSDQIVARLEQFLSARKKGFATIAQSERSRNPVKQFSSERLLESLYLHADGRLRPSHLVGRFRKAIRLYNR